MAACVVYCGNFVVDVMLAIVHVDVVRIWTAHQTSVEYVVVWIRTVEFLPVTYGRRGWARTAKICIACDTAWIERLSWFLDGLFSQFSFPFLLPILTLEISIDE